METGIRIKNLCKAYPSGTRALKGIDLEIHKGRFFTLLGPNGAGKSTLIRILTTLVKKDTGEFQIGGLNPEEHQARVLRLIGVASQENELDPDETALNQLVFQGVLFGMKKRDALKRADELVDAFDLAEEKNKRASALSGGNRKRLHCSLALVHRPSILFLDEPTVGMDPAARANFWKVVTGLNRAEGMTVFLTTQYLEEADRHASGMALIVDGEIRYAGGIAEFKQMVDSRGGSTLEDSYLQYLDRFHKKDTLPPAERSVA